MPQFLVRLLLVCAIAVLTIPHHAQVLVKDFRTDSNASGLGSRPGNFVTAGGTMYFSARSPHSGYELWKSDGTQAGTVMVKDINAGIGDSDPTHLTSFNGQVLFVANDGVRGLQLWISDGTTAGTRMVHALERGFDAQTAQIVVWNGIAYFRALWRSPDGMNTTAVWRTDGTAAGTTSLMTVCSGACFSSLLRPQILGALGDKLIFSAFDAAGIEPWVTDGTPAGTTRLADIVPSGDSLPTPIAASSNAVYFWANDPAAGREPWKTDGTPGGTQRVHDLEPGGFSSGMPDLPLVPVARGSQVFFTAHTAATGTELWVTDGTSAGTVRLTDTPGFTSTRITHLFAATSGVYFTANENLWKSDGTVAGTVLVRNVADGGTGAIPNDNQFAMRRLRFGELNGVVYLAGGLDGSASELLRTDGSAAGTMLAADIYSNVLGGDPAQPRHLNGRVFFHAGTPDYGTELWSTDGTTAGTTQLRDVNPGPADGTAGPFHAALNRIFFAGNDGVHGWALWSTDGTANGTQLVADMYANRDLRLGTQGVAAGNKFFFDAADASVGRELWVTDGTAGGTRHIAEVCPSTCYTINGLREYNGKLFFATSTDGFALWISDGTAAGTIPLMTLDESSGLLGAVVYRGKIYALTTYGLYESDGTPGGTQLIEGAPAGGRFSGGAFMEVINDRIVFVNARELWTSDGTEAGTQPFFTDVAGVRMTNAKKIGGTIFYARSVDGVEGDQLWKTDGTAAGTVLVKTINPSGRSAISEMTDLGGVLYFQASDGVHGAELWRSDGTAAGTVMVSDLEPGPHGSAPGSMFLLNGAVYFAATRSDVGRELWMLCGAATQFAMQVSSATVTAGSTLYVSATALNSALGVHSCYTGRVRFTTNDPAATLPPDYRYTSADAGGHLFTITLRTPGPRAITVYDIDNPSISGTVYVEVVAAPEPDFNRKGDFDGDGKADLIWRNGTAGQTELWRMDGATRLGVNPLPAVGGEWTIAGIADFDGDFRADLLWRRNDGAVAVWLMNGAAITSSAIVATVSNEWVLQGAGDFSGDGRADLLWRNSATSAAVVWTMNGTTITGTIDVASPNSEWTLRGIGDFNGDRIADLLWHHQTTHDAVVWLMNGGTIQTAAYVAAPPSEWNVLGVGDFNADSRVDILWRHSQTNGVVVWLMNGASISGTASLPSPPSAWVLGAISDFDGDRDVDLVWRNTSTGENAMWVMNGTSVAQAVYLQTIASQSWQIAGPR